MWSQTKSQELSKWAFIKKTENWRKITYLSNFVTGDVQDDDLEDFFIPVVQAELADMAPGQLQDERVFMVRGGN